VAGVGDPLSTVSLRRLAAVLGGGVALGSAGLAIGAGGGHTGAITITVPGAMNLAVHCGGEETHFSDGDVIRLVPEGTTCDIEAPLSPVMPVRGELAVDGWSSGYRCRRKAMELDCVAE
jgi:hypothetical protein